MSSRSAAHDLIKQFETEANKQGRDDPSHAVEDSEERDHFEFRPLTKKEKKEFMNSLDAKGRQILAELEGKASAQEADLSKIVRAPA